MTSEMDGRDCLVDGASFSSGLRRGSAEELMLEAGGRYVEGYEDGGG